MLVLELEQRLILMLKKFFGKLHVCKNRKIKHSRFKELQLFFNPLLGSAVVVV